MTLFGKLIDDKLPRRVTQEQVKRIRLAYPKVKAKVRAEKAIHTALKWKIPFGDLLSRTEAYAAMVETWRNDPDKWRLVPLPSSWYNDERWEDDDLIRFFHATRLNRLFHDWLDHTPKARKVHKLDFGPAKMFVFCMVEGVAGRLPDDAVGNARKYVAEYRGPEVLHETIEAAIDELTPSKE